MFSKSVENLPLVLSPIKMNLERENRGYWMTGQNGIPWNASGLMSGLEAIRLPRKFQVEPHLFQRPPILPNWFLGLPKGF
jgi:hypothetical protein